MSVICIKLPVKYEQTDFTIYKNTMGMWLSVTNTFKQNLIFWLPKTTFLIAKIHIFDCQNMCTRDVRNELLISIWRLQISS